MVQFSTVADPEIRAIALEGFQDLDTAFAWSFRTAIAQGELPASIDIAALSQMATAVVSSLAIRARAGVLRAELETIANGAIDVLCPGAAT